MAHGHHQDLLEAAKPMTPRAANPAKCSRRLLGGKIIEEILKRSNCSSKILMAFSKPCSGVLVTLEGLRLHPDSSEVLLRNRLGGGVGVNPTMKPIGRALKKSWRLSSFASSGISGGEDQQCHPEVPRCQPISKCHMWSVFDLNGRCMEDL